VKKLLILMLMTLAATTAGAAKKQSEEKAPARQSRVEAEKALVRVNGVAIPEIEAKIAISDRMAAGQENTPALQNAVRNQLIARELFAQQARKAGLDKNAVLLARKRMAGEELLARAYQEDYLSRNQPGDEAVRKEYDAVKARAGDKEYRVRHIVAASEEDAKVLLGRLKAGERFADLAVQSRDEATRASGGDIGWQTPLNLQPQFVEVVTRLAKGQYTQQAVKGPAGWHLIQVDDIRPFNMPALDDKVKRQVHATLARRALDAHLVELGKAAKVEP
jgi:peptidyl-prolyl cis-trans isomerase C